MGKDATDPAGFAAYQGTARPSFLEFHKAFNTHCSNHRMRPNERVRLLRSGKVLKGKARMLIECKIEVIDLYWREPERMRERAVRKGRWSYTTAEDVFMSSGGGTGVSRCGAGRTDGLCVEDRGAGMRRDSTGPTRG